MKNKIFSLENLRKVLLKEKSKRKKIVLCHGVFDLLHIGHIKHFEEAKKMGDILVVTLTPDVHVNKGPKRPTFNEKLRAEAIASLSMINYVALNTTSTALNVIQKIKPDIYCKGPDYKNHKNDISGQIKNESAGIKKVGGKVPLQNHYLVLELQLPTQYQIKALSILLMDISLRFLTFLFYMMIRIIS